MKSPALVANVSSFYLFCTYSSFEDKKKTNTEEITPNIESEHSSCEPLSKCMPNSKVLAAAFPLNNSGKGRCCCCLQCFQLPFQLINKTNRQPRSPSCRTETERDTHTHTNGKHRLLVSSCRFSKEAYRIRRS